MLKECIKKEKVYTRYNAPSESCYVCSSSFSVMKDLRQLRETLSGVSQAALYSVCQNMTPSWHSTAKKHQRLPLAFCHSIYHCLKKKIFLSKKAMSPVGRLLCNKGACQVMLDRTNDGSLTLLAYRVHPVVFKNKASKESGDVSLPNKKTF